MEEHLNCIRETDASVKSVIYSHVYTRLSFLVWFIQEKTCQVFRGEAYVAANGLSSRAQKLVFCLCISTHPLYVQL